MSHILNYLIHALDAVGKNFDSVILRYIVLYWTLLVGIGVLLLVWDLLISFLRYNVLHEIYCKFKNSDNLRTVRNITEFYYIFDKISQKLSIGIIRYLFKDSNRFRDLESTAPLSIIKKIKTIVIRMVKIDILNIIIWIIIAYYINPKNFGLMYQIIIALDIKKILEFVSTFEIPKLSNDLVEIIILLGSVFGINLRKYFSKDKKDFDEKGLEEVMRQQKKIEKIILDIILKAEENIDLYSSQIDYYSTCFCEVITGTDKFYVLDGVLNEKSKNVKYTDTNIDEIVGDFATLSNEVNELIEVVKKIEEEDLSDIFNLLNKPNRYEFIKLGLYRTSTIERMKFNFFDKEALKKFFENWTNNGYLKEQFSEIRKVWFGYVSKEEIEQKLRNRLSIDYPFAQYEEMAIEKMKKKLKDFEASVKFKLADAVWHYVLAKQYYEKSISNKIKDKTLKNIAKLLINS